MILIILVSLIEDSVLSGSAFCDFFYLGFLIFDTSCVKDILLKSSSYSNHSLTYSSAVAQSASNACLTSSTLLITSTCSSLGKTPNVSVNLASYSSKGILYVFMLQCLFKQFPLKDFRSSIPWWGTVTGISWLKEVAPS